MQQQEIIGLLKESLEAYRRFDFGRYMAGLCTAKEAIVRAGNPPQLLGELVLIEGLQQWNYMEKLVPILTEALALLQGPSRVIPWGTPLLMDRYGPFGTLWLEQGKADSTGALLEEAEGLWLKLAGGGQGTALAYKAHLSYCRGHISESQALAWEAYEKAEANGQTMTMISAAEILGLQTRHGMRGIERPMDFLRQVRAGKVTEDRNCIQAAELVLCGHYLSMGVMTETPLWIRTGDFGAAACPWEPGWYMLEDKISPWLFPVALSVRMEYLCYGKRFVEALNLADLGEKVFRIQFPLSRTYFHFWRGTCYGKLGYEAGLDEALRAVMDLCAADGLWLIPGEDKLHGEAVMAIAAEYGEEAVAGIQSIGSNLFEIMRPMRENYIKENYMKGLTPQEYKVARLIYGGASNGEAARQLHISEQTVKNHLRRVYEKLEINSRREIAGVMEDAGEEIYAFWTV